MCERAREWASLRLDSELSELESALLDSHLRRCAACADYSAEIGVITAQIRAAELEPLVRPTVLPLRRRFGWAGGALQAGAASAALIVATVALTTQVGSTGSSPSGVANAGRLPLSAITSGPNSVNDALIRLPRLVNLRAQFGFVRPRGLQIDT
jgi:predicted anti-sigma-YlaC factor YlaD